MIARVVSRRKRGAFATCPIFTNANDSIVNFDLEPAQFALEPSENSHFRRLAALCALI